MKKLLACIILLSLGTALKAQDNIGVNNHTSVAASPSALLDLQSTTKGLLIPRMTAAQRAAIVAPVAGLMVYQTDAPTGFYFYGASWNFVGTSSTEVRDADNDTKVQVEETGDEDKIRFDTDGAERMIIDNGGLVGIGTTSPSAVLDVVGTTELNGDVSADGTTFNIDATNNRVGVGTATPSAPLDVVGTTELNGDVSADGTTFNVDATNNRVGVGTSTPTVPLDVVGATNIAGATQITGDLSLKDGLAPGNIALFEGSVGGNQSVVVQAPAVITTGYTLTMPPAGGAANEVLQTDGTGVLSWVDPALYGIYRNDGTLTGNRAVNQNSLTLDFNNVPTNGFNVNSTAVDGFGVDGTTFSVDGANNRVGIGTTTPSVPLDVVGAAAISGAATVTGLTSLNGGIAADGTAFTVADATGNVHTDGSLDANGATTLDGNVTLGDAPADIITVTGTIAGSSPLVLEGATANAFETTIAVTDPTAARTITLPDASGTVALDNNGISSLTTAEVDQLENIDATTISTTQWGYLGSSNQGVATTDNVTFNQVTGTLQTAAQPNITSTGTLTSATVSGATNLNGSTTIGDAGTDQITVTGEILGASPLNFEGFSDNGLYTTLAIADPTAARTIILPDASGTVALDNSGISSLTTAEIDQLENIDLVTISNAQWGYVGSSNQGVATTDNVTFNQVTGTLQTAAQPNVTSVGTLSSLTVSGATNLNGAVNIGDAPADVVTITGTVGAFTTNGTITSTVAAATDALSALNGNISLTNGTANLNGGIAVDATNFTVSGVTGAVVSNSTIRTNQSLILEDPGAGTNTVTIEAPVPAASYTLTLPIDDGAANQVLSTDGSGVLSWTSQGITFLKDADTDTRIELELTPDEDRIRFTTLGGERMYIDNAGNVAIATSSLFVNGAAGLVGIGTATPNDQLDVVGTFDLSGTANLGNTVTLDQAGAQSVNKTGGALNVTTAAGAVNVDATGGGISLDADAASNFTTSGGALSLNGATGVNIAGNASEVDITTTGTVDINSAAYDLDASGAVTIDGLGLVSLDGAGASNFTTSSGDLTLSATSNSVIITGVEAASDAIDINATNGGIDMDAAGSATINAAGASNFTTSSGDLTLNATTNSVVITGVEAASDAVDINATAGSIDLDGVGITMDGAASGVDINASGGTIDIGADGNSTNINIGTLSARTITIGNGAAVPVTINTGTGGLTLDLPSAAANTVLLGAAGGVATWGTVGSSEITNASVTETDLNTSVAGNGLTGGAGSALAVGAGTSITVNANDIQVSDAGITGTQLNTSVAGGGLTGGGGAALAVGAGTGITVNANDVALTAVHAGLSAGGAGTHKYVKAITVDVYGRVTAVTDGNATADNVSGAGTITSDRNAKENILPIQNALEKVMQLNGYTFNYKDIDKYGERENIGVIAQEIEKVFPNAVTEKGEFKAVFYNDLIAVLLEAIKEQQQIITDLTTKNLDQDSRLERLESAQTDLAGQIKTLTSILQMQQAKADASADVKAKK